jgi:hypothetical protein
MIGGVPNRSKMSEREIADLRQGDFCAQESRALTLLRQKYPIDLSRRSLYSLATVMSTLANVRLERDFARRKELLIKWFDDNYEAIEPFFQFIELIGGETD